MKTITDDYYGAYELSCDGCRLKLDLVLEKESEDELIIEIPIFEEYMNDMFCITPFEIGGMICSSITIWYSQYETLCFHEKTNIGENFGIYKIYRDYERRLIIVFNKFYIDFIQKLYFGMDVHTKDNSKNEYRFELRDAYFSGDEYS